MKHTLWVSNTGHFRKECAHGVLVSTCRCPSDNKTVEIVACPTHCTATQEYVPKHAKIEES